MRIIHYYRDIYRPSGVTKAIAGWQEAALVAGTESLALHAGSEQQWHLPNSYVPHVGKGRQFQVPNLSGQLKHGDVLFLHEGWVTSNLVAARQAVSVGVPYVVVPHGVYEPSIISNLKHPVSLRKRLERRLLEEAAAVQTFYPSENAYVREIAGRAKTFSVATGIDSPEKYWEGGGDYLAWFGRYSVEHKGIDNMLAAYAQVPREHRPPLRLRGVDYHGGRSQVMALIQSLGIASEVSVGGPVFGEEKEDFLAGAAAFLFPSRWESQGIALLEALRMGVPCVVSRSIHVASQLVQSSAARVVDFSDHASAALEIPDALNNRSLSERARAYVQTELSWNQQFDSLAQSLNLYVS